MIRFCGSNMLNILSLSFFYLLSLYLTAPIMENVIVEPPLAVVNLVEHHKLMPDVTISAINCNSFNMGTVTKHARLRKFYGIVSLKTEIIFLSDIRMCNKKWYYRL
jgi:hypothetical protein